MTKDEAIKFANCLKNNYTIDFNDMADFCDMAIKALEQQPSKDYINRKVAIDELKQQADNMYCWSGRYNEQRKGILIAINIVSDLPSVTPQPRFLIHADGKMEQVNPQQKTGHWIEHKHGGIEHIECSKCHVWFLREHLTRNTYCPECGSYNGGEKNE